MFCENLNGVVVEVHPLIPASFVIQLYANFDQTLLSTRYVA
jgi:hypothetical protein